jgi:hypothetical protein
MNRTRTFHLSWTLPLTMFASIALSAGASPALGQAIASPPAAQSSAPTIMLSTPKGDRLTLVHSPDAGWQLQGGWPSGQQDDSARPTKAMYSDVRSSEADTRPVLERPLTVFVDGPTGYTFIYLLEEGWRFVGQVADGNR